MQRGRAFRRAQEARKKKRVQKYLVNKSWLKDIKERYKDNPRRLKKELGRAIGLAAHSPKICSCEICGNPRRSKWNKKHRIPIREQRELQEDFEDDLLP